MKKHPTRQLNQNRETNNPRLQASRLTVRKGGKSQPIQRNRRQSANQDLDRNARDNRHTTSFERGKSVKKSQTMVKSPETRVTPLYIWGKFDMPFLLLTLALLGVGLVMLFSASHAKAYYYLSSSYYYIGKQLTFAVVGVVAMLAASFVNYQWLRQFSWLMYGVSFVMVAACYLFQADNGAKRWIWIGDFGFQPSEIAKFAIIVLFSHLMTRDASKMQNFKLGTLRYIILYGAMAVVVVFQPHLSATILMGGITVVMMFVGGSKISHMLGIGAVGGAGLVTVIIAFSQIMAGRFAHVLTRLSYWLDPFATNDAGAYQTKQSLLAIGSGGLLGVGLGESRQKHMYLPEVQNDFVFSVICEELGFVGATMIIILFAMTIWRGFTIALRAKDRFGCLLAVGLTTQFGLQAMLNIAVVTNFIPNTGISLPLFSSGGTALMMMMGQLGFILSVSRQSTYEKE